MANSHCSRSFDRDDVFDPRILRAAKAFRQLFGVEPVRRIVGDVHGRYDADGSILYPRVMIGFSCLVRLIPDCAIGGFASIGPLRVDFSPKRFQTFRQSPRHVDTPYLSAAPHRGVVK